MDRLLDACTLDHLRLFCTIALHTLQRPGAILELRTEQVNLRSARIDFLPPGEAQSRKRRPVVPVSDTLQPLLAESIGESETGFVVEWNGRPVASVGRAFRAARNAAGLGTDVTPYTLRHTGATLLLAAGVPIRQVAGMLGHTEERTTELYGKHHVDFLGDAKRALDRLFGRGDETMCAKRAPESTNASVERA